MSLKDYIEKKFEKVPRTRTTIDCSNFFEQSGYALFNINLSESYLIVENFLIDFNSNISLENEINFLNKIRCKKILDDKDLLQIKENYFKYCSEKANLISSYLDFLLEQHDGVKSHIEFLFDENKFPEFNVQITLNNKKYITKNKLQDVKYALNSFVNEFSLSKTKNNNCVFYGEVKEEHRSIMDDYIKKISWNLSANLPNVMNLNTDVKKFENKENCLVCEIKASTDDVFVSNKSIHIINESFIPKRIRWIKI